jgi:hypothetical protein
VLERDGQEDLAQLAPQRPLVLDERRAHQLLRDGAAALPRAGKSGRDEQRARHALPVDARVLEEPVVLGGQEGLDDHLRQLRVGHGQPALLADLADQAAVPAVDAQRHLQLEIAQLRNVRERGAQVIVGGEEGHPDRAYEGDDQGAKEPGEAAGPARSHARLCIHRSDGVRGP